MQTAKSLVATATRLIQGRLAALAFQAFAALTDQIADFLDCTPSHGGVAFFGIITSAGKTG